MTATAPARGDRFAWSAPGSTERDVFLVVTRVAEDGAWADVRCYTCADYWTKRQRLPMPTGAAPYAWTWADLDAQRARFHAQREANRADPLAERGYLEGP